MRNHLPVGAVRQQQLWNLGKGRGKGRERERGKRNQDISTGKGRPPKAKSRLWLQCEFWKQDSSPSIETVKTVPRWTAYQEDD